MNFSFCVVCLFCAFISRFVFCDFPFSVENIETNHEYVSNLEKRGAWGNLYNGSHALRGKLELK